MPRLFAAALAALLLLHAGGAARAHGTHAALFDQAQALATSQQAIGRTLGDFRFTATDGREVRLGAYRGRPVVLNLIYTSCDDVCPLIVQSLARAVAAADQALGPGRFAVLTVGFDVRNDTPARMKSYAGAHGIARKDWTLLSTDPATIEALAAGTGFQFVPRAGGFDHLAQVTLIDAAGRVQQQIYGDDFAPPALVDPLKRLVLGEGGHAGFGTFLLDRVRLICTVYDPASGRYRFSYAIFMGLAIGAAGLGGVGVWIVRMMQQARRA